MENFFATAAIILMTTTSVFAQGTNGHKAAEELNRALDNYLATGIKTDGVGEVDMKPRQELIEKLNMAVKNSSDCMTKQDCVARTDNKPSDQVNQDIAGTTTKSDVTC